MDAAQLKAMEGRLFVGSQTHYYGEKPVASRAFTLLKKVAITVTLAAIFAGSSSYFSQASWMPFAQTKLAATQGKITQAASHETATPDAKKDSLAFINEGVGDNTKDIVKKLIDNDERFLATAVIMEGGLFSKDGKLKPYTPPEGRNNTTVGIGYCIPERVKAFGIDAVKGDFTQAGISAEMQDKLLAKNATKNGSFITQAQAIRLLATVAPYYKEVARGWLGEDNFDKLDKDKQAALTWLAYNVGKTNIGGFHHLKKVATEISKTQVDNPFMSKQDKTKIASLEKKFLDHITPSYVDGAGDTVRNERVGDVMKGVVNHDYLQVAMR